jgi:cytochrome c oxidase cbb3-type subunit 2
MIAHDFNHRFLFCCLALVSIASFGVTGCSRTDEEDVAYSKKLNTVHRGTMTDEQWTTLWNGKHLYEQFCSGCHGVKGDGAGPAAAMLKTKPRNFTRGMFKFVSTHSGTLPTDGDLNRTLLRGIPRTSMPNWNMLPEADRNSIIQYIKTFSTRWQENPTPTPLSFSEAPGWIASPPSIAKGRAVYARMGCANCHGTLGHGDGMSSATLVDAYGNKIEPFNFTDGVLKGGSTVKDIYRTFYTGLAGTPMPSFGGILSDDDNWHLVSYVLFLMGKTRFTTQDIDNASAMLPAEYAAHSDAPKQ